MTKEYHPNIIGGLGTAATDLTEALVRQNIAVTVWNQSSKSRVSFHIQKGADIIQIPKRLPYYKKETFSYIPQSLAKIAVKKTIPLPDLIHVHSLEFTHAALYFKKKYGIPVLYTCHSLVKTEDKRRVRSQVQRSLFLGANRIVSPSLWLKGEIRKYLPKAAKKTVVIPNGTKSVSTKTTAPRRKLLFVGRVVPSKGVMSLVLAVALLRRQFPGVNLTIIGKGSARYRNKLLAVARKKGIAEKIRWIGYLPPDEVKRKYASYGTVVVPSMRESFCLVALEAMANGVPLVSTKAGGLQEFVNPNNAQIIRAVNSKGIAKAIRTVLQNPGLTRKRVKTARLTANRFRWVSISARYAALYQKLQTMASRKG